jgi:cell division protein FtsB
LLVKAFFGDRGFIGLLKIKSEYASILEEVNQLESEKAILIEEINKLNNDKYYQEKLAREKMGFIKEGEVVYLFAEEEEKDPYPQEGEDSDKNH